MYADHLVQCAKPDRTRSHNHLSRIGAIQVDPFTVNIPLSSVSNSITVDTLAGNDLLTLDFSGCGFIPSGGILYNGGTQTGSPGDQLVIIGGSRQPRLLISPITMTAASRFQAEL